MNRSLPGPENFFSFACYFEGSLAVLAVLIGWVADVAPFESLHFSEQALGLGLAATLPLMVLFTTMNHLPVESLQAIRRLLLETLGPALQRYHWADLLILALVAGISEELLFRGVLQPWLERVWSAQFGLVVSNMVFGLVHAVTPLYALLAALIGAYLGWMLDYGGERNLLTPIVIHAAYDFFAFLMLVRTYRRQATEES